jgi:hypothetical protein
VECFGNWKTLTTDVARKIRNTTNKHPKFIHLYIFIPKTINNERSNKTALHKYIPSNSIMVHAVIVLFQIITPVLGYCLSKYYKSMRKEFRGNFLWGQTILLAPPFVHLFLWPWVKNILQKLLK